MLSTKCSEQTGFAINVTDMRGQFPEIGMQSKGTPNIAEAAEVPLTQAQTVALPLLAAGAKKKDAAAAAGVCPQTVSDWLNAPHFAAAIKAKREELTELASARLAEATNEAVGAVIDLMKSTCESTRFKAATYVLDRVLLLDARAAQNHQNAVSETADLLISLGVNCQ